MKKSFFILALSVCCLFFTAHAQKSRVGLSAGVNIADIKTDVGGSKTHGNGKKGATFGLIVNSPIGKKHFSFEYGLYYSKKGSRQSTMYGQVNQTTTIILNYAETIFNFLYNKDISGGKIFMGLGPTFSFELPECRKVVKAAGVKNTSDLVLGNSSASFMRGADFGANAIIGIQTNCGLFFSINYTYGLRDLSPITADKADKMRNTVFGIRTGWLFKNK